MRFQLKKTITRVTVLTALIPTLSLLAADALAHKPTPPSPKRDPATSTKKGDYVYDAYDRNVHDAYGGCVITGFWTPATATYECHPDMFEPRAGKAAAPAPAAPPKAEAAPAQYEPYSYSEAPKYEYEAAPAPAAAAAEPDFYAPGDRPDLVPVPPMEEAAEAEDKISEPRHFYEEESTATAEEGITGRSQYYEEEGVTPEEGILSRDQYYDEEEVAPGDDGILAYRRDYEEEEGAQKEEGIIAQRQYYEEEEGAQKDDGILAQNQYYEEEEGAQKEEGIVAQSQTYEEEGKEAAENISEPKAFPEEQVAAAEEKKPEVKPAPEPEAKPAPKPEPKPVVLPVTITVEADALFDFDRYNIRSDARAKLDKLVDDLRGVRYDKIVVVGHADRIGTKKYNQRLSERRASSAKTYLVGKGLPADQITTEGRGELEPETTPEQCKGLRKAKLIACLQPDRRVEVTVTGQK